MKNMLVTGETEFIGSNFIRTLMKDEQEVQVFSLDALTSSGSLENLKNLPDESRHTLVEGNICDRELVESILRQQRIDTICHFAAESHVDRSILGPAPYIQTNVVGTFTLPEAARQVWLSEGNAPAEPLHFHHVSTDEVFGSLTPEELAFYKNILYNPCSPYSASKAASDHLVRAYFHTYGLPVTITNCSNNYGLHQFPEKLIPLVILNTMQAKTLPIYGDGRQLRDWLYVEDHCEAICRVIKDGRLGETYNLGGGNQPCNIDLVRAICTIFDELRPASAPHVGLIVHIPGRPGHDRRYAMDITKIDAELGWTPRHDLFTGLRATVEWYLSNPE